MGLETSLPELKLYFKDLRAKEAKRKEQEKPREEVKYPDYDSDLSISLVAWPFAIMAAILVGFCMVVAAIFTQAARSFGFLLSIAGSFALGYIIILILIGIVAAIVG